MLAELTAIYFNIILHAQIQQFEIYSPLCPPVSESLIVCTGAAIITLMAERVCEMNGILNHGYEIK